MEALRYLKNIGPLTPEQQCRIREARVCIIGCGGIGGYTAEHLCRLGVGHLTLVDGDCFDPTNLNRQLFCTEANLGLPKVTAAQTRLTQISSQTRVDPVCTWLREENALELLQGHDLVIDGLDRPQTRLILQAACRQLKLPLVHGAVEGWGVQVCTVLPGEDALSRIYPAAATSAPGESALSFVAGLAGALQAAEAAKLLTAAGAPLTGRILFADLMAGRFDVLPL